MIESPQQIEFASIAFPKDRTVLYVDEVAARLRVTKQHVLDLIEEGKIQAVNIAGKNATDRKYWRIPMEAYEAFLRDAHSFNSEVSSM